MSELHYFHHQAKEFDNYQDLERYILHLRPLTEIQVTGDGEKYYVGGTDTDDEQPGKILYFIGAAGMCKAYDLKR